MRSFSRKKQLGENEIAPTKLNSSKVIVNLESGNSKKVTKAMLEGFKTIPYDRERYYVFGSNLEARYYTEILLPDITAGKILVRLQPKFTVWEKSEKQGIKHMAITYTPDFGITPIIDEPPNKAYGQEYFVDVKGMQNETLPLKHKLFDGAFPDFPPLVVMKHWAARGGWMTLEKFNTIKRTEKKAKKKADAEF